MSKSEELRKEMVRIQDPVCFGIECPESIVNECREEGDPCLACRTYRLLKLLSDMKMGFVDEEKELPEGVFDYKQHERIFKEAGWRYVEKLEVKL